MSWWTLPKSNLEYFLRKLKGKLDGKVDKVDGLGLSSNDYTTVDKNKLSGIASGAQVNVIETVKVNNTALTPSSKAVNITVPTKVSELTNDSGYITSYTDDKVQQIASNDTDGTFEMIFAGSNSANTQTTTVRKSDRLKFNPSTGVLSIGNSNCSGALTLYESLSGAKGTIIFFGDTDQSFLLPNAGGFIALTDDIKNGKLTIQKNGTNVATFTANQSSNATANITVPTKVSELTNDSGYTNNTGTITGITMNGASKGTSGVVDLGTVITSHQDISGKADKSATVSTVTWDSTNKKLTKTINGTASDVVTGATILGGLTVKVGTTSYTPSSGVVSLPAYPTTLPASDVYAWAKASTKPSYTLDEVSDGSTRKLANYLPLAGGTLTGNLIPNGGITWSSNTALPEDTNPSFLIVIDNFASGGRMKWAHYYNVTVGKAKAVPWSGVSDKPTSFTPSSHTHGNIQNGGTLQTNDITIANGDKLVVTDSSDSSKIARASISFDGSTATKCLTQKGTWESFLSSHQSVTNKDATLAWSTKSTVATIGSTNITVSLPANPNTDTKVTQSPSTTNGEYELLFSGTADNTERTEGVKKSSDLTYNPYFKLLELPGGSIDTQMFTSEADGYEQGYMTSVRSGNNIHCTLKLGGENSAVGILRIGNSSGKDAFIKYDSRAASSCDITLPCKDGTLITTAGGATMIGSLSCSTPGADLHWGDITIYGGGSNGNTNAMLIGDDVIIGDCNIGGYMGMKAKSGSTVGFKFMNSSGGNIGELKSNNGALQFVQSGTPRDIWHDGNWSATRALNCRIIYEYGSGSPRIIGIKYTSSGYMEVSCDTTAYGVNWWQSDTKLKENIKPTEKTALDKVDQIEFIQFDWKNKKEHEDNTHVDLGVSANQIEEFMPDTVWNIEQPETCEFDTLKNIDTGKMATYALKAIQELHKIVESQAQEIANLKSQLT